jgi:autotransporter-associated beta strand protein
MKKNFSPVSRIVALTGGLVVSIAAFLLAPAANAQSSTWTSTTSSSWNSTGNWANSTIPGSTSSTTDTDTATFNIAGTGAIAVTVDTGRNLQNISFDTAAGSYTFSGGSLLLTSGGTLSILSTATSTGATESFATPITLEGNYTFANTGTTTDLLSITGGVTAAAGTPVTLTLGGTNTQANAVGALADGASGGVLSVNKIGAGSWTLSGTGSYTGGLTMSAGTLNVSSATAFGTGTLTLTGGTVSAVGSGFTISTNNSQVWDGSFTVQETNGHTFNMGTGAVTVQIPSTFNVATGTTLVGGTISGGNGIFDVTKTGGGTLSISESIALPGSASETLNVTGGIETFTGTITSSGNPTITVAGGGAVALSGSAGTATPVNFNISNTSSASTSTLYLDSSTGSVSVARANSVTLSRGALIANGSSSVNAVDSVNGNLTIDGSNGYVDVVTGQPNAAKYEELSVGGSLAETNGGVVLFRGTNLGANAIGSNTANNSSIVFGTAPTLVGGGGSGASATNISIIPYAIGDVSAAATANGSTFVTYTSTNGIVPLTSSQFATSSVVTDGSSSMNNLELTGSTTYNSNTMFNSLLVSGSTATTIGGTGTLTISSGAVLLNPGNNGSALVTINSPINFGNTQGYIGTSYNRVTSVNGAISGTGGLTLYNVNGYSTSNPVGPVAPTNGVFTFGSSANTYSGNTYILGSIALGNALAFPSYADGGRTGDTYIETGGSLVLNAGQAVQLNGLDGGGYITFSHSAAASVSFGDNNANGNFSGTFTDGLTNLNLIKIGTGTETLSGTNSTYFGTTSITNGTLAAVTLNKVSGGASTSSLGAPITVANGTIALGSTTTTGELSDIGTGETTDRVINLAGSTGGGILDQSGTGTLTFSSSFTATGVGSKTLTLQGSTSGVGEIDGAIVDHGTGNTTALYKTGTGTWTLGGTNTYSGGTTVNAGNLVINAAGNTGSGTVAVSGGTGATISGTGTSSGAMTISNGSHIAPGINTSGNFGGVGTLAVGTTGGLTITNANLDFDLATTAAGSNDLITTNALTLTSGTLVFNFTGTGSTLQTGTLYELIGVTGATPVTGFNPNAISTNFQGSLAGNYTASYSVVSNDLDVTFTAGAVPEPSTWALLAFGMLSLGGFHFRRYLVARIA